jgi:hypothetical protein
MGVLPQLVAGPHDEYEMLTLENAHWSTKAFMLLQMLDPLL